MVQDADRNRLGPYLISRLGRFRALGSAQATTLGVSGLQGLLAEDDTKSPVVWETLRSPQPQKTVCAVRGAAPPAREGVRGRRGDSSRFPPEIGSARSRGNYHKTVGRLWLERLRGLAGQAKGWGRKALRKAP